jgi:hypothetical protein
MIDKLWKRVEKDVLAGIDDKDRRQLRKILRQVERNLGAAVPVPLLRCSGPASLESGRGHGTNPLSREGAGFEVGG